MPFTTTPNNASVSYVSAFSLRGGRTILICSGHNKKLLQNVNAEANAKEKLAGTHLSLSIMQNENGKLAAIFSNSS